MAADMRSDRISAALNGIKARLTDGDAAKTERDELRARLTALAEQMGTNTDGLTDRITALSAKAADMDGVAALVGNISNTAYKLLPSSLRALLDKYRT